jgi:hypothetical protein
MKMQAWARTFTLVALTVIFTSAAARATTVKFAISADDYGSLTINGTQVALYDNPFAAGGANGTFNMTPGQLYNITIVYENRLGSDGLSLAWDQPGLAIKAFGSNANAAAPNIVPLSALSNAGASGLNGTYYDLRDNYPNQTVAFNHSTTGEGPIDNGFNNGTNYYNGAPAASWSGYSFSSPFEEVLTGQIELPSEAPLPAPLGVGLALFGACLITRRLRSVRAS